MNYREYIEDAIKVFKEEGGEGGLDVRYPVNGEEVIVLLDVLLKEAVYLRELWDKFFIACAEEESKKVSRKRISS